MRLWICEELQRTLCMILQSRMEEQGHQSILQSVEMLLYFSTIVDEETFHAGLPFSDGDMVVLSASSNVRNDAHFVKKSYSLQDAIRSLFEFKPRFLMRFSGGTMKRPQCLLEDANGDTMPGEVDGTEERAAPRPSSSQDGATSAASAGSSGQHVNRTTTSSFAEV